MPAVTTFFIFVMLLVIPVIVFPNTLSKGPRPSLTVSTITRLVLPSTFVQPSTPVLAWATIAIPFRRATLISGSVPGVADFTIAKFWHTRIGVMAVVRIESTFFISPPNTFSENPRVLRP
jgi:hypothetical protein